MATCDISGGFPLTIFTWPRMIHQLDSEILKCPRILGMRACALFNSHHLLHLVHTSAHRDGRPAGHHGGRPADHHGGRPADHHGGRAAHRHGGRPAGRPADRPAGRHGGHPNDPGHHSSSFFIGRASHYPSEFHIGKNNFITSYIYIYIYRLVYAIPGLDSPHLRVFQCRPSQTDITDQINILLT